MTSLFDNIRARKWTKVSQQISRLSATDLHKIETEFSPEYKIIEYAIGHNRIEIVKKLLAKKDYVDLVTVHQLLGKAIQIHYNPMAELLLKHLSLEYINYNEDPLLHTAVRAHNLEMLQKLLVRGANVNLRNRQRLTPLHLAVQHGYLDILHELLKQPGLKMNVHSLPKGDTALGIAMGKYGNTEIAKLLIAHGANVNSINYDGINVLAKYQAIVDPGIRQLLLREGVNVNQIASYNRPLLDFVLASSAPPQAKKSYLQEIIPLMDPLVLNTQNFLGQTILEFLILGKWWEKIRDTLVQVPWDIFQADADGQTLYAKLAQKLPAKEFHRFVDMIAESYQNTVSKSVGTKKWEQECQKFGTSTTAIRKQFQRLGLKLPAKISKDKMCAILIQYQIEFARKSYPGTYQFNLAQKIDIIARPRKKFQPILWQGRWEWEFLLNKHILQKHADHINNNLPTKKQYTKHLKLTGNRHQHIVELNTLTMFSWDVNEKWKMTLEPPRYLNPKRLQRPQKQFDIFYLHIRYPGQGGHANSIIIDHKHKTIERFEPHGYKSIMYYNRRLLDQNLRQYFVKYLPQYQYLDAKSIYPRKGVQAYEGDKLFRDISYQLRHGYCSAWSMWYCDLIFTNWDIIAKFRTRQEFINAALVKIKKQFSSMQKYILTYVEQTGIMDKLYQAAAAVPGLRRPNQTVLDIFVNEVNMSSPEWRKFRGLLYDI